MANMLMMRYAASRSNSDENGGNQRDMRGMNERMNTYDQPGMAYHDGSEMRQPNQYTTRSEYDGAESRYRGKDGRWRSGTRRSMGEDGSTQARYSEPKSSYMGGEDDDDEHSHQYKVEVMPSNVIPFHEPHENYRTSRQIGFGAQNNMEPSGAREQNHMMGKGEYQEKEFDRHTAEKWVRSMRNEDKAHPVGGKWSPDMLKPLAQKYGIPTDGKRFWEFYAMTNAMYSDYGEVARKFGITSPEFYVCMAKAWMDDKDAEPEKTALYYEYIVKKE